MPLRVERCTGDTHDGIRGDVYLLLFFEGGDKPVQPSVAVHVESM